MTFIARYLKIILTITAVSLATIGCLTLPKSFSESYGRSMIVARISCGSLLIYKVTKDRNGAIALGDQVKMTVADGRSELFTFTEGRYQYFDPVPPGTYVVMGHVTTETSGKTTIITTHRFKEISEGIFLRIQNTGSVYMIGHYIQGTEEGEPKFLAFFAEKKSLLGREICTKKDAEEARTCARFLSSSPAYTPLAGWFDPSVPWISLGKYAGIQVPIAASVTRISDKRDAVVINIGSDEEIVAGNKFRVYKKNATNTSIADLIVVKVKSRTAMCSIQSEKELMQTNDLAQLVYSE